VPSSSWRFPIAAPRTPSWPRAGRVFLAEPVEYPWEIRAFFRDPDGHLFEISQRKREAVLPAR